MAIDAAALEQALPGADRTFPSGIDTDRLHLVCRAIVPETQDAKSYFFATQPSRPIAFRPGQFLTFRFRIDGEEVIRSYSISSSAAVAGPISATVKRIGDGLVSNWLFDNLRVGDHVEAEGPGGIFVPADFAVSPLLLISAGSGITPMASTMRTFADRHNDIDVVHIHFARSGEEMMFLHEMLQWARRLPRARIVPIATRPPPGSGWVGPTGRINLSLLHALVPDLPHRTAFCCGPQAFMEEARALLLEAGVPENAYHEESFCPFRQENAADAAAEAAAAFRINFRRSQITVNCGEGTTLARAAHSGGVRLQTACGQGICGTCRTKLVSGTVDMSHQGGIKQREIDQGWILPCCSRPTSNIVLDR